MAMSLFILLDPLIVQDEFKAHCVFYMALMAFSTVLINGTTAKYVLEGLGLLKMNPQQLDVLQYVLKVRCVFKWHMVGMCGACMCSTMMQSLCCRRHCLYASCLPIWYLRADNHAYDQVGAALAVPCTQEVDRIPDHTLAASQQDDVLGAADPTLVKRWSKVDAAASLSPAHNRVLRRLQALRSGGRPGSKGDCSPGNG